MVHGEGTEEAAGERRVHEGEQGRRGADEGNGSAEGGAHRRRGARWAGTFPVATPACASFGGDAAPVNATANLGDGASYVQWQRITFVGTVSA